jgi:hypothetical protein
METEETKEHEPRIQINPESTKGLDRWLEVSECEPDGVPSVHVSIDTNSGEWPRGITLSRREWCVLAEELAIRLWKTQDEMAIEAAAEEPVMESKSNPPFVEQKDIGLTMEDDVMRCALCRAPITAAGWTCEHGGIPVVIERSKPNP